MGTGGIVLVGAPGSGKTSTGRALGERGYWFEDREAALLARYGSIDEFRRQKDAAVARLHAHFLADLHAHPEPWVYESTALTERDFVTRLRDEFGAFVVHLEVPLATALARVTSRAAGANLSNDDDAVESAWHVCTNAYESMPFDLVVSTGSRAPGEVAAAIDTAFRAR